MSIRILGGMAKGQILDTPKGHKTRPTGALLKRRAFDYCQSFSGITFIDLCAGTGSIGIEAWSRGADKIVLVEKDPKAFKILEKNVSKLQSQYQDLGEIKTYLKPVEIWTDSHGEIFSPETIIFLDPPYESIKTYERVLDTLYTQHKFPGILWIECDKLKGRPVEYFSKWEMETQRHFEQGDSYLLLSKFKF